MIVPMRKVTLFCLAGERERALERLRALGVVHLRPQQPPAGEDLDRARRRLQAVQRALEALPADDRPSPDDAPGPDEIVEEVVRCLQVLDDLEEERGVLVRERARIAPFGDFDPDTVRGLEGKGIFVRLYHAAPRAIPRPPADTVMKELRRGRDGVYFVLIGRDRGVLESFDGAGPIRLPRQALSAVDRRLREIEQEKEKHGALLRRLSGARARVAGLRREAEDEVAFLEAQAGMGKAGEIVYLSGYLPADTTPRLSAAARRHGWGVRLSEPGPEDHPPTLTRPPRWAEPIRPVLDMINLVPGYRETDISALFLVFFCLFFGMLVGDAGYGLLFVAAGLWVRRRFPHAPRPLMTLLWLTSAATLLWGILTGAWFGAAWLPPLVPWLVAEHRHLMALCFGIGAAHLALAHLWRAWQQRRSPRAWAQLGWTGSTVCMFFVALNLVVGADLPRFIPWVLGASVLLIVLFMTSRAELRRRWIDHAMLPLTVINNFVDVVSYVRLFAVGLATLAVAQAFNDMALGGGIGGLLAGLVAGVVLVIGHTLNIVMALIGVMVHGLRLNALEFSGHMGVEWSGYAYRPFRRQAGSDGNGKEGAATAAAQKL